MNTEMANSPLGFGPMGMGMPSGINPFMGMNPNPRPIPPAGGGIPNLSDIDIEQMMRDIDKKIAELDAEEERKKKEIATNQVKEEIKMEPTQKHDDDIIDIDFDVPSMDSLKNKQQMVEPSVEPREVLHEVPKPKINIDADSIVVDNNVISDDEFFDDFFDEGE